jgi:hypothetical protein
MVVDRTDETFCGVEELTDYQGGTALTGSIVMFQMMGI